MPHKNSNTDAPYSHILIMRSSAMGDVAMLAHTLRAFRKSYPSVRLTLLTRRLFEPFFDGLDVEIVNIDFKGRHKGLKGLWQLYRDAVRGRNIEAFADMHGVVRSTLMRSMMLLSGRRVAVINKGKFAKWLCIVLPSRCREPLKHTIVRYGDVLRKLGFRFDDPTFAPLPVLRNPMGRKRGKWVGFAPFSAHAAKSYPLDMCEELVGLLSGLYDRLFIHSGAGEELEFAMRMEQRYKSVTALYSRLDLREEIALISHLDCIVTMDSLSMHMASLTATPVVSVWGATHPSFGFVGWGCDEHNILQSSLSCRPCSVYGNRKCRMGDYRCLRAITPRMIADRVEAVVAAGR